MQSFRPRQSGQVALMVLLIMVVLLTAGLALASRTAQDLILSQQQVATTRVFNAAEQGIEQALSSELIATDEWVDVTGLDTELLAVYDVDELTYLETLVFEGVSVEFDLSDSGAGDVLEFNWSRVSDCGDDPASLVIGVFSNDGSGDRVRYYAVGPCSVGRADGFTAPGGGSGGYSFSYDLVLEADDLFARIKPVYNDTYLKIEGPGWNSQTQFYRVRAEAESEIGDESRAVEVWQTLSTAPSVFDYAVYSGTSITK